MRYVTLDKNLTCIIFVFSSKKIKSLNLESQVW